MSKIKKLLLSSVVAIIMAIAFVIGLVGLKQGDLSSGGGTSNHLTEVSFNEMFDVKQYTHEIGTVKVKQGGSNLKYEYTPNVTSSNSIAYQYIFNNPMNELMAINLKSIDTTGVTVSYAYSDTRLKDITSSNSIFEPQTIASKGTKYFYIVVTPDSTIPTSFQANVVWYQGKAGTLTITNTSNNTTTTQVIVKGQSVPEPATPSVDEGYVFSGWYLDEECTIPADFNSMQGSTLYPKIEEEVRLEPNLPSDWIAWDSSTSSYYVTTGTSELPTDLVIPGTYNDGTHGQADVTYIGYEAFFMQEGILSLDLSNCTSLTTIGENAFQNCFNLVSVNFSNCVSLSSIEFGAFYYASSLNSVDLQDCISLTTIKDNTFGDCISLKSIVIPENVVSIGEDFGAFNHCYSLGVVYNLSSLTITAGSSSNGYVAYYAVVVKTSLDNSDIETINGVTYYKESSTSYIALGLADTSLTSITLHANTTIIRQYAFYENGNLENVDLTNCTNLTNIGICAFSYNYKLSSIVIPATVNNIESYAFESCFALGIVYNLSSLDITVGSEDNGYVARYAYVVKTSLDNSDIEIIDGVIYYKESSISYIALGLADINLTSITLHPNTTVIKQFIFYENGCLESVDLSNCTKLKTIGECAFSFCYALLSVDLTNCTSLTTIGEDAFENCVSLTISLSNCTSLTTIGDGAFFQCMTLTNVDLTNCTQLTTIGESAFSSCESLEILDLSNCTSLETIGEYAFSYCYNLLSANLSNCTSLTTISDGTFYECSSLSSVTLPNSLEIIGANSFRYCSSLTTITIPASVKNIGTYAFGSSGLTSATFKQTSGWYRTDGGISNYVTVSNSNTAATYLKSTYNYNFWYNTNAGGSSSEYQ